MAKVKVANANDLKSGEGKVVTANGKTLALFNVNGKFHAIENACLHRGGPLGEGSLEGNIVTCPWHGFQYDVTSGQCLTNPSLKEKSYPVEVNGEDVYVDA